MKLDPLYESARVGRSQIPPALVAPVASPVSAGRALILVVDDSITMRTILEMSLRRAGYACLSFADGASALRWLSQSGQETTQTPRLLLLDVEMPGMDGYQLAQTIRAQPRWQALALVMLTAHDRVTDRLKGRLLGVRTYLTKPFRVETLLTVVQDALHDPSSPN